MVVKNSTAIKTISYDPADSTLNIIFRSGSPYNYKCVPRSAVASLIRSESKGRYFVKKIRNNYEYERLDSKQESTKELIRV